MPRVAYTEQQKLEAVALARLVGVDVASEQLGIDFRTIRKWQTLAGDAPQVAAPRDMWQRLFDKAAGAVEAALASGTMSPAQKATIAAIATRNIREEKEAPPQSSLAARELFYDWICDRMWEGQDTVTDEEMDAADKALTGLQRELLRRANAEPGSTTGYNDTPAGHRLAMLAWYSGKPEVPAEDILEWSKAQVAEIIEEHGDVVAWHQWRLAKDAEAPPMPPHIAALLAQAQAFLESDDAV